ncbi:MAG: acylphosphatase [Ignavibacteria bacterium]|nr:acylphosphatase [Ignavibacteria bacterium]
MYRAEIFVNGLVQGVGFRYFVVREANRVGLKGFVKNLSGGEVLTVVEGEKYLIEELYNTLRVGPRFANVKNAAIKWTEFKNEFEIFEVRY